MASLTRDHANTRYYLPELMLALRHLTQCKVRQGTKSKCALRCRQEIEAMEKAMRDGEGCNIEGWIEVLRVAGNFHISVHSQVRHRAKGMRRLCKVMTLRP